MVLSPSDIRVIFPITLNSGKMEYAKENTQHQSCAAMFISYTAFLSDKALEPGLVLTKERIDR
jgi:hypothetical protein